jgi:hypothetical protein
MTQVYTKHQTAEQATITEYLSNIESDGTNLYIYLPDNTQLCIGLEWMDYIKAEIDSSSTLLNKVKRHSVMEAVS